MLLTGSQAQVVAASTVSTATFAQLVLAFARPSALRGIRHRGASVACVAGVFNECVAGVFNECASLSWLAAQAHFPDSLTHEADLSRSLSCFFPLSRSHSFSIFSVSLSLFLSLYISIYLSIYLSLSLALSLSLLFSHCTSISSFAVVAPAFTSPRTLAAFVGIVFLAFVIVRNGLKQAVLTELFRDSES